MESLVRWTLVLARLPEPRINADVFDSHGGWIARPDLSWPDRRIAIEYDGRHHFTDARQWENDIARRHNLEDEAWAVRVVTARDVLVQPRRLASDVVALWRRRS
jgi:very-short-patch-repair endonuclease